ncbi:MAG: response regulator [Candidatus Marinimicrobia bacterium]|nr:response regulator [Candidatus Neomarinimicrobiota bacterium]
MELINTSKKTTLLIVEDDMGWRLILKHMMLNMNLEAIYAETGEDALKIISERDDVSIVIMDVSLGNGMSGLDLGERIKSESRFKDTPMIAMTAYEEQVLGDFHNKGFTGYLRKPYSLDQLGKVLDTQVSQESAYKNLN